MIELLTKIYELQKIVKVLNIKDKSSGLKPHDYNKLKEYNLELQQLEAMLINTVNKEEKRKKELIHKQTA